MIQISIISSHFLNNQVKISKCVNFLALSIILKKQYIINVLKILNRYLYKGREKGMFITLYNDIGKLLRKIVHKIIKTSK